MARNPLMHNYIYFETLEVGSDFDFGPLKQFIRISADELDSVGFRYPMPNYLLTKYLPRIMSAIYILVPALLFWALYTGYIKD
jgi:hypothetical protein